ncbi:MAG: flavin reductase family protein [Prevotellaceae bacterium]|nr:flavin reductase family protein [Prevotellaceae bacterium]
MKEEKTFQAVNPKEINENAIQLFGDKWTLITAGDSSSFNTMTASWGTMGTLWNKPVVFVFIRPQRYTFEFTERKEGFTLSFFKEEYREALQICGTVSGRDVNKIEKAGITPYFTPGGNVAFKEAYLVLECKKLYADFLDPKAFIDPEIASKIYPENDFHKVYVAEIVGAWEKK